MSQAFAGDHKLAIQPLPIGECHDENLSVYALKHQGEDYGNCVLYFSHPNYLNDPVEGKVVLMRLNGVNTELYTTRQSSNVHMQRYEFANGDATVRATMNVKVSCREGVEGCDYSGWLTVESQGGKSVVRIGYYRGA